MDCDVWLQTEKEHDEKLQEQRRKQHELIEQLRNQLEDLESYAYEVKASIFGWNTRKEYVCTYSMVLYWFRKSKAPASR